MYPKQDQIGKTGRKWGLGVVVWNEDIFVDIFVAWGFAFLSFFVKIVRKKQITSPNDREKNGRELLGTRT
eukprot:scaffold1640_cov101-Cylindrotheca_fusiformis.AAC.7